MKDKIDFTELTSVEASDVEKQLAVKTQHSEYSHTEPRPTGTVTY